MENHSTFTDIDTYIQQFPPDLQPKLQALRETIRKSAPEAFEKISYQMPTFDFHGNLVHFACFKHHIGFYPGPSGIEQFKNELVTYSFSKGAIRFPIDKELPLELIRRIVAFRVDENVDLYLRKRVNKTNKKRTE